MHDIKDIRQRPEVYKTTLTNRGLPPETIEALLELDSRRRCEETALQQMRSTQNLLSDYYGLCKRLRANEQHIEDLENQMFEMLELSR